MTLNNTTIQNIVSITKEIMSQQTADDIQAIKNHVGEAYNHLDAIAGVAVELALRLYAKGDFSTRAITPLTLIAKEGERLYRERFTL
jgi:hypothetical protein